MKPLVSVVIANHNYGRFLAQCLDSVLAQSYAPIEIVVVDDGSSDESRNLLRTYATRVRAICQENSGQAVAMNRGVQESTGDLICFLDADDGWYAHKVERAVATMQAQPQVGWLRHKLAMVDESRVPMGPSFPRFRGSGHVPMDPRFLLERIVTAGTTLVLRRNVARQVFPLQASPDFAFDADAILLAHLFRTRTPGYSLDEVLGYYRRHDGQRYVGPADYARLLQRELAVADAIAHVLGAGSASSSACKHRAVLAAMAGARWWQPDRLGSLLHGLVASSRLWPRPALCLRQTAALLFAYSAPHSWLRKLERTQAFAALGGTLR